MFLAPKSMIGAVKKYCEDTNQQIPQNEWEVASVIYNSLGKCYGDTIKQMEEHTGKKYKRVYVVGGGANAEYLNKITAKQTGCEIYAGPAEATAIGNLAVQMLANKEFKDLKDARKCISESFEIKKYQP